MLDDDADGIGWRVEQRNFEPRKILVSNRKKDGKTRLRFVLV